MRVLIVGKAGSIVHWEENALATCHALGWEALFWAVNGHNRLQRLWRKGLRALNRRWLHRHLADDLARTLERWPPQLVLFIGAYHLPLTLYEAAAQSGVDHVRVGWVGDRFPPERKAIARHLHRVYYTDSGFVQEAAAHGFPDHGRWLPLAADEARFKPAATGTDLPMVFVANATAWRLQVLQRLRTPIAVYGRGWRALKDTPHWVRHGRLPQARVPGLYARSLAVLNVRNEQNLLAGLNQRIFEASACGRPVLNDAMPDLERCFDPQREVLVWRELDELNEIAARVTRDPVLSARVGEAARRRVLAEHTWRHRLRAMVQDLDLS